MTTVSQTYAREITTAEFGCGLEGLLKPRADRNQLSGILNGIDESWDPRTCSSLLQPFGAGDWAERSLNAEDVRDQFGLAVSRGPLFALVARLVHQKGVDLVIESAQTIVDAGGQNRRHWQGRGPVRGGFAPSAGARATFDRSEDRL
ncbi:glycogen synthase [Bradyrhizobium sp. S3.2.12]